MKPLVALLLTLSLAACFPNSAKHRTYAKVGEGAAIAAGIGMLYMVNSGADCDQMRGFDEDSSGCRGNAEVLGAVGFGLVLAGLVGFIATISTSPEDPPEPITVTKTTTVTQPAAATK